MNRARAVALVQAWQRGDDLRRAFRAESIPQGMGKTTFLLPDEDAVLQIRPRQTWHEPVALACQEWSRRGCRVADLLFSGSLPGFDYYLFRRIDAPPLSEHLPLLERPRQRAALESYGAQVRKMCSIQTEGFGEFARGLTGGFTTWGEFVLARTTACVRDAELQETFPIDGVEARQIVAYAEALIDRDRSVGHEPRPHLVYVDVSMSNALIDEENLQVTVIDYDYIISGDPCFALSRFWAEAPEPDWFKWFAKGFGPLPPRAFASRHLYRLMHTLELLAASPHRVEVPIQDRRDDLESKLRKILEVTSVSRRGEE